MERDSMLSRPVRSNAGFAIGPILFVLAILSLLAMVMAAGTGDFGTAATADRVSADISTQANLIRSKINECNLMHGTSSNYDGYPSSDTTNGTAVSAIACSGDPSGMQNLWTGSRPALLPPPTKGFGNWMYINTNATGLGGTATGGRCIWIAPTLPNPNTVSGIVTGLTKAATKFSNGTSFSSSNEVIYDPASASQKFVVWISMPTGSPDSNCIP
jgi:hypothetical protein